MSQGTCVSEFWPYEDRYYSGFVQHMHRDGAVTQVFDGGEPKRPKLSSDVWRFGESSAVAVSNSSSAKMSFSENLIVDAKPVELKGIS